uniref:Uncharacterized protein n=1 Tax=Lepeophtheirus salmonis TaxID=72036 RepID=A0A0K2THT4_LEPSM
MKIQNHRGYLFGLNFPRSRHSSEIIRIKGIVIKIFCQIVILRYYLSEFVAEIKLVTMR